MGERGTRPDYTRLDWARLDKSEVVEPGSGLKDAGYPDGATPANEEHNSEFNELSDWATYLQLNVPRTFDTLGEALDLVDGTDPGIPILLGERFVVDGLMGGNPIVYKLGDSGKFESLGNPIVDMACDGQKIYVAVGSGVSGRRNLGSLATQWVQSPGSPNVLTALEADGLNVYAAYITSNNVYVLDPSDGSTNATITGPANLIPDLAANGVHLLIAQETSNDVDVYDTLDGTPNLVGTTLGHGALVKSVALDHDQGYVTGAVSSGVAVRAFALTSPGAWLWSATIPGLVSAGWDVKADGAFVYVVGTLADGNTSAWCLCRADGSLVWGAVVAAGQILHHCAVDHRHLWVTDTSDVMYALDKSSGVEVFRVDDQVVRCCDGHQAFAYQPGGGGNYTGHRSAEDRIFRVVGAKDPDRRPFPRISMPEAEPPLGAQAISKVFGDEYQTAEETTAATEATSTPKQFLRLTTPAGLPAGTYEIGWYYVWQHSSITTDFAARVQIDDTTDLIDPSGNAVHREEPTDVATTQRIVSSGFATVALTAGAHNIDIDFWSATGTGTAQMFHARLRLMRVS
jgi:hypothetical protein